MRTRRRRRKPSKRSRNSSISTWGNNVLTKRLPVALLLIAASAGSLASTQTRTGSAAWHGVITGRVLDASHQPVPDVLVVPLWKTPSRTGETVHPVDVRRGSITNASGAYRIDQLPPGSLYLVAL